MKVIILRGLPASGKTFYAKKLQAEHPGRFKRVNKDDLRAMLDDGVYSKGNEKFLITLQTYAISMALKDQLSVIVDDTGFNNKHNTRIQALAEKFDQVTVEFKDFTHVSLITCLRRNKKRGLPVPQEAIRGMFERYLGQGTATQEN